MPCYFSDLEAHHFETLQQYWNKHDSLPELLQQGNHSKEFTEYHERLLKALDAAYIDVGEEIQKVIDLRYKSKEQWTTIADELYTTVARTKRLAEVALRFLAIRLGWIYP